MYQKRVERNNTIQKFAEVTGASRYEERQGRAKIIQNNRARVKMVQSLLQRLNCPARARRPAPKPACTPVESPYEEILTPPVTYEGCQAELFPEAFLTSRRVPPRPICYMQTQIEPLDVYDFDIEVQPLLEVLVGTSVREAMHDAITETELTLNQAHRVHFRSRVTIERAELECLSEQDRRYREEKERREAQFPVGCVKQGERAAAAAPLQHVKGCKDGLRANALEGFRPAEYRRDVIKKDLQVTVIPLLLQKIRMTSSTKEASRDLLAGMVRDATINVSQQSDIMEDTRCRLKSCSSNDTDGVLHSDEEWQIFDNYVVRPLVKSEEVSDAEANDSLNRISESEAYENLETPEIEVEAAETVLTVPESNDGDIEKENQNPVAESMSEDEFESWAGVINKYR